MSSFEIGSIPESPFEIKVNPDILEGMFKKHFDEMFRRWLTGLTWTLDEFRKECCGNKAKEWVTLYILLEFADEIDYRQPGGWLVPSKGRGNAWIIRAKQACEWMDKNFTRIEWERKLER